MTQVAEDSTQVPRAAGPGLLHPGPLDPTVLYDQRKHRSQVIWDTGAEDLLNCRRNDICVHRHHDRRDIRVQRYLYKAGFYGLYHIGYIRLDRPLITALVERWRPETHTFHLPPGECTVTLQDIQVLAGVRVDGKPVTGLDPSLSKEKWQDMVERLLGERPDQEELKGGSLRLSWINERFGALPDGANDEVVQRHSRAVILLLLGGQYLSDKSSNMVKLMYLPLLEDLEDCGRYSWGSAMLATLYREMCRATCPGALEIAGPLVLLQIWAWSRFTQIRPRCYSELPECPEIPAPADGGPPLPVYPYGWRLGIRTYDPDTVGHNLRHYRDQFDSMREDQMVWEPYKDVLDKLPDYCVDGKVLWRTRSPLICFAIVEYHYPDRVLRQFGMRQDVPRNCIRHDKLHGIDRRGKHNVDWASRHREYVEAWASRHRFIVASDLCHERMVPDDEYMIWYGCITRKYMRSAVHVPNQGFQPTAAIHATMLLAMGHCYTMAVEMQHYPMIELLETTFREINFDPRQISHISPFYAAPPSQFQSMPQSQPQPKHRKRHRDTDPINGTYSQPINNPTLSEERPTSLGQPQLQSQPQSQHQPKYNRKRYKVTYSVNKSHSQLINPQPPPTRPQSEELLTLPTQPQLENPIPFLTRPPPDQPITTCMPLQQNDFQSSPLKHCSKAASPPHMQTESEEPPPRPSRKSRFYGIFSGPVVGSKPPT